MRGMEAAEKKLKISILGVWGDADSRRAGIIRLIEIRSFWCGRFPARRDHPLDWIVYGTMKDKMGAAEGIFDTNVQVGSIVWAHFVRKPMGGMQWGEGNRISDVSCQMSENTVADKGGGGCDKWSVVSEAGDF